MKRNRQFWCEAFIVLAASILTFGCNHQETGSPDLKQLQERQAADYVVAALHETGRLQQGASRLFLEFRRAPDRQLVDVGDIQVSAAMPMSGMPDMVVEASAKRSGQTGRYEVNANFSMAGTYRLNVTFGRGQQVQFELQVA